MSRNAPVHFAGAISDADRARQFIPFMALKGYFELCREKERRPAPKHALTEEETLELSQRVASLKKGDMVKVVFYDKDAYVTRQEVLSEIVEPLHFLRVVRQRIDFDDILSIEAV